MVKIDADLATLMANPDISVTTSPFAPGKMWGLGQVVNRWCCGYFAACHASPP